MRGSGFRYLVMTIRGVCTSLLTLILRTETSKDTQRAGTSLPGTRLPRQTPTLLAILRTGPRCDLRSLTPLPPRTAARHSTLRRLHACGVAWGTMGRTERPSWQPTPLSPPLAPRGLLLIARRIGWPLPARLSSRRSHAPRPQAPPRSCRSCRSSVTRSTPDPRWSSPRGSAQSPSLGPPVGIEPPYLVGQRFSSIRLT